MNKLNTSNTMTINDFPFPIHTGAIKPDWIRTAQQKGFNIVARVVDRLHLALQCKRCGHVNKVRLFTLMSAQPLCVNCVEIVWRADAQAAGLEFIKRDPSNRHYGIYRMSCGHEICRQFALVKRTAVGKTGLRCERCHAAAEVAEAQVLGWDIIGPDPEGDPNYRLYRHVECGHEQRFARANVQSQRISCGACGTNWPAAPSFLYAMGFTLENGRELVKAGFSRNPWSRLHHQLKADREMPCAILRTVPVPTGQEAIRLEKRLHSELKQTHPDCIVDTACYRGQIRVVSEIYDGSLTPTILARLGDIEAELGRRAS
ncbi:GIY-YIG nuclease family protein [Sulfitobacter sp. OXR-159]|jgi:hypothetical protein|uniref:GIY-YIG nuclease family protein n=1 Tax=Sulfitobacter sp. OXR-159 TaxID=3100174 RepID=UPI002AC9472D|nr:GIY-YIG nuclease family protein [Sulfitobacter sp. OXR-159]WPZ29178.1 GIY-YIG nuclease family protein [Sulfitobacter sp. OXR-159]